MEPLSPWAGTWEWPPPDHGPSEVVPTVLSYSCWWRSDGRDGDFSSLALHPACKVFRKPNQFPHMTKLHLS